MSNLAQPKPIPATIGTIFGGVWALIAAFALPSAWQLPAAALALLATMAMIALLWRADATTAGRGELFVRRPYRVAVVAEFLAICAASLILPRLGLQLYVVQAVGLIVGLHFIGLWAATRSSRFLYIMVFMCLVSVAALLLPPLIGMAHSRDLFTGVGNALVLWLGTRWPRSNPSSLPSRHSRP